MSDNLLETRVHTIRYEAEGILSLELRSVDGTSLPEYSPGSHIDLHLSNGLIRSYSLFKPSGKEQGYVVGILRDRQSRGGSAWIHDNLRVGALLTISAPRNNFPLAEESAHSVLVAGGIGITPILCMLSYLTKQSRSVELIYCARSRQEAAFIQEIEQFNCPITWHFDDEKQAPPDFTLYLNNKPVTSHFYCCGPSAMINSFEDACEKHGYSNIHVERFSAKPAGEGHELSQGYMVELSRSGKMLTVSAGQSLLDVILASGCIVNCSCREGICGSCEIAVIDGVVDHRDSILSNSERAANKTMMVCVSGCKSGKLVLDL
ncbi:PDR/VanB family oxidoreductase [Enterobacter hormaechei]|uniref:PDR/VanB family oxidoreductase n=1 Tax=Enterobacter hormaechei TaxID=158836 RepID=UPI0029494B9A|nr:PDR/VanB family oxidoreductase [Enterobacter hormaechei]MDV5373163.1 PDR/VanB family oxidoreductase [Enterobacter hormaechei]